MEWYIGDITTALSNYQEKKGILIVYVHAENESNSTNFEDAWRSFDHSSILNGVPYVAIRLEKDSEGAVQFAEFFPTPVFPVCYILGLNAQPLEVVTAADGISADRLAQSFRKAITLYKDQLKEQGIDLPPSAAVGQEKGATSAMETEEAQVGAASGKISPTNEATDGMSKDEKLEYYRKRLEEKRNDDAKKKEEEAKAKEIQRRNDGKAVADLREKQRAKELREMAEERRKQKEDDAQALKRIRDQLRQDKEQRAKRNKGDEIGGEVDKEQQAKQDKPAQESTSINNPVNTEECRIQCRFPDGSTMTKNFPSKSLLQAVHDAVAEDSRKPNNFFLIQPYPRQKLTEYDKTLMELNLTPSSVLLVVAANAQRMSIVRSPGGYLDMLFSIGYFPIYLIASIFRYFNSFIGGTTTQPKPKSSAPKTSSNKDQNGKKESEKTQREGNFGRFRDDESGDSDDQATWNGNSTQQL